jgi:hypothetical protein
MLWDVTVNTSYVHPINFLALGESVDALLMVYGHGELDQYQDEGQNYSQAWINHWLSDAGDIKIGYRVKVPFKVGEYVNTVECVVAPMTVCHLLLLLGRPWQYDCSSLHCGRTNQYTIKWKGKS